MLKKLINFTIASIFLYEGNVYANEIKTFDLHFVVITNNPDAKTKANLNQLYEEVNILNEYFVKEDRSSIVNFRFKSASLYDDIKSSTCHLVDLGDAMQPFNLENAATLFNDCTDIKVRDKNVINIYIFDEYSDSKGFNSINSYGKRNSNKPFIFLDWKRLNHTTQSPEEHEMGHAFGLSHVCVPGATINSSTNIMASASCGLGSGGKRDIGFDASQVQTILHYVPLIEAKLASQ